MYGVPMTSYLPLGSDRESYQKGLHGSHAFLQQSFLMCLLCAKTICLVARLACLYCMCYVIFRLTPNHSVGFRLDNAFWESLLGLL